MRATSTYFEHLKEQASLFGKLSLFAFSFILFASFQSLFAVCSIEQAERTSWDRFLNTNNDTMELRSSAVYNNLAVDDQITWRWYRRPLSGGSFQLIHEQAITINTGQGSRVEEAVFRIDPSQGVAPFDRYVDTPDAAEYAVAFSASCTSTVQVDGEATTLGDPTPTGSSSDVNVDPIITIDPDHDASVIAGSGQFDITVQGSDLIYQWEFRPVSGSWGPISPSDPNYSGSTSDTLTLNSPVSLGVTGYYRVKVTHPYGTGSRNEDQSSQAEFYLQTADPDADGLCRSPVAITQNLQSYPTSGEVDINESYYVENLRVFNGLGGCNYNYSSRGGAGTGAFYTCEDSGRATQDFFIKAPNRAIIDSSWIYERFNGSSWVAAPDRGGSQGGGTGSDGDITYRTIPDYYNTEAQPSDSGNYRVRLTSAPCDAAVGFLSNEVPINVIVDAPVITAVEVWTESNPTWQTPTNTTSLGQDAQIRIRFADTGSPDIDMELIRIVGTSETIVDTRSLSSRQTSYTRSFDYWNNITSEYFGRYKVRVTNPAGVFESSEVQLLQVGVPPQSVSLMSVPSDLSGLQHGDIVSFIGTGDFGDAPHGFSWERESPAGSGNWSLAPGQSSDPYQNQNFYNRVVSSSQDDNVRYRVRVINASGEVSAVSDTLSVDPVAPSITDQPDDFEAPLSGSAIFTVVAEGSPTLAYQWQKNGVNITPSSKYSGLGTNQLQVLNIEASDVANYRVIVSNGTIPNATSEDAALTLVQGPQILSHPSSLTVTEGQAAQFNVVATGSGSLSYQWKKNGVPLSTGGRISGATTSTLTINPTESSDAATYTVSVTDDTTISVTSNGAVLTVNGAQCEDPASPSLLTPADGATTSSTDVTTSWSAVSLPNNCTSLQYRVRFGTASSIRTSCTGGSVSDWTSTTSEILEGLGNEISYNWCVEVQALGASSQSSIVKSTQRRSFTTPAPDPCDVPSVPQLLNPTDGETLSSTTADLSWAASTPPAGCGTVQYRVHYGVGLASCSGGSIIDWETDLVERLDGLGEGREFGWCIQARATDGSRFSTPVSSLVRTFNTPNQSGNLAKPSLSILPNTTGPDDRSGETRVTLTVSNVESGALVRAYEVNGSSRTEIDGAFSLVADGQSSTEIVFDISRTLGVQNFEYQVRQERPGTNPLQSSEYSDSDFYYFDSSLTVQTPEIVDEPGFKISWRDVADADEYIVYRRHNKSLSCPGSTECYFDTPFEEILVFSSSDGKNNLVNGVIYDIPSATFFFNEDVGPLGLTTEGASYFVRAGRSGQRSLRSESRSFGDTKAVFERDSSGEIINPPVFEVRSLGDGRTAFYMSDVDGFNYDNSADLRLNIQYQERTGSCASFVFDGNKRTFVPELVDALSRVSDVGLGIENAVFVAETTEIEAGRSYCFQACVEDVAGNKGSVGYAPNDPDDATHCLPLSTGTIVDETPPDFNGLSNAYPGATGYDIIVEYPRAEPTFPEEFVQYEIVFATRPDFSDERRIIVPDIDQLQVAVDGLDSDQTYYIYAEAFDAFDNRKDGSDKVFEVTTRRNHPNILSVEFLSTPDPLVFLMKVVFSDRNFPQGDRVRITNLSVGPLGRGLNAVSLESQASSSSRESLLSGLSSISATTAESELYINLQAELGAADLAGFQYTMEVTDQDGLKATTTGQANINDAVALNTNSFVANGQGSIIACSAQKSSNTPPWLVLALGLGVLWFARKRRTEN